MKQGETLFLEIRVLDDTKSLPLKIGKGQRT
jgi:hypothetical protein